VPAGQSGSGAVLQRLYNQYIEHYKLAEEVGFDGIMLNEHHNAPFCMQAKCNVFASILAAITERVKIVLLPQAVGEPPHGQRRDEVHELRQHEQGPRCHPGPGRTRASPRSGGGTRTPASTQLAGTVGVARAAIVSAAA
jgi:hypothetical protein